MQKAMCAKLDKIESDLLSKALKMYNQGKYSEFWRGLESLDVFLSVKEGLGCPVKRRKK